jgi:hypothetical protein
VIPLVALLTLFGAPWNFDPFMSLPPTGTCLVHETSGDVARGADLRGVLPAAASLTQPNQSYNNGTQLLKMSPAGADYSTTLGGTINSITTGMNLLGANGTYTVDPSGPDQTAIPLTAQPAPAWSRPNTILVIPRNAPSQRHPIAERLSALCSYAPERGCLLQSIV